MSLFLGQHQIKETHLQQWLQLRDQGYDVILNDCVDPITLSNREDALLNWLEDYEVEEAWKLAEPLAVGGIEVEALEHITKQWQSDATEMWKTGLHWLVLSLEVAWMLQNSLRGGERIANVVQAMKSYSYLDQAPQQEVEVHQGLEDTLRLFAHKIKHGIQVERHYEQQLPKILAYESELNQVWLNLIDNAIDAMKGNGKIEITTTSHSGYIEVGITDFGQGIPVEIQNHIFDPFFTTKGDGGFGLGLEIVRRVIEARHHGRVQFTSRPGRTSFWVQLPVNSGSNSIAEV
ncbi:sensor histidine kinase [Stenomitos frigidus]|nr:ATP-binding protein [Stenomitos frigidus]